MLCFFFNNMWWFVHVFFCVKSLPLNSYATLQDLIVKIRSPISFCSPWHPNSFWYTNISTWSYITPLQCKDQNISHYFLKKKKHLLSADGLTWKSNPYHNVHTHRSARYCGNVVQCNLHPGEPVTDPFT